MEKRSPKDTFHKSWWCSFFNADESSRERTLDQKKSPTKRNIQVTPWIFGRFHPILIKYILVVYSWEDMSWMSARTPGLSALERWEGSSTCCSKGQHPRRSKRHISAIDPPDEWYWVMGGRLHPKVQKYSSNWESFPKGSGLHGLHSLKLRVCSQKW